MLADKHLRAERERTAAAERETAAAAAEERGAAAGQRLWEEMKPRAAAATRRRLGRRTRSPVSGPSMTTVGRDFPRAD